jgi:hypothetical protein
MNFLEPSGPLQACNGTALPLPVLYLLKFNNTPIKAIYYNIKIFIVKTLDLRPFFVGRVPRRGMR